MASFGVSPLDAERRRLERRRALVDILQKQAMAGPEAPTMPGAQMSPYQGLAKMGEALIAALANRAQEKREKAFSEREREYKTGEMNKFTSAVLPYDSGLTPPSKPETFTPTETMQMPDYLGPPMPQAPEGMDMAKVLAMQTPNVGPQINITPAAAKLPGPPASQYGPPSASEYQEMQARPAAPAMLTPSNVQQAQAAPTQTQAQPPAPIPASEWVKSLGRYSDQVTQSRNLVDAQRQALSSALMSSDPRLSTFMLENIQQGNKDLQAAKRIMLEAETKAKEADLQFQRGLITEQVKNQYRIDADQKRMDFDATQNAATRAVTTAGQQNQLNIANLDRQSRESIADLNRKSQESIAKVRAALDAQGLSESQKNKELNAWNSLADNYRQAVTKPKVQADAYLSLSSAYGKTGAGADIPFMYNYIKFLDPNAVREGELQLLQSGQSLPADVAARLSYVAPGLFNANGTVKKLDPKYKEQLFKQATQQYESTIAPALFNQIDTISAAAKRYGIDPKLVIGTDAEQYPAPVGHAIYKNRKIYSKNRGETWYYEDDGTEVKQ